MMKTLWNMESFENVCWHAMWDQGKSLTHSSLYTFSEGDKILLRPSVCVEFRESLGQAQRAAWAENEED